MGMRHAHPGLSAFVKMIQPETVISTRMANEARQCMMGLLAGHAWVMPLGAAS